MPRRWLRWPLLTLPPLFLVFTPLFWNGGSARAQPAKTEAVAAKSGETRIPAPALSQGWEYDEEVTRSREELENIQLWLNAKKAQLKAAESSSQIEHKLQGEYDRLLQKRITTPIRREIADLEFLESESQRALILAEIGELQSRYNRTKRYLARLEQYGTSAMKSTDDRTLELTEVQTRLRYAERMISKLQEELKDTKVELEKVTRGIR
jgi:chromosome segregation ATPase